MSAVTRQDAVAVDAREQHDLTQPPRTVLAEAVAAAVEQVAVDLGASCLVEARDGRVVAHCVVGPIPDAAVAAVLSRTSLPLQAAAGRRRTIAVSRGGGVQELELDGWGGRAVTVPIVAMGETHGWLWVLLGPGREVEAETLSACAGDVARAAAQAVEPAPASLVACLLGTADGQLPRRLRGEVDHLWVTAVRSAGADPGSVVAGLLDLAVRDLATTALRCAVASIGPTAYLVVGGPAGTAADAVLAAVEDLLARSELVLRAGVSDAVASAEDLPAARVQADEALAAAGVDGRAVTVAAARAAIVLRHLCRSFTGLPDLGPHPVTALLDYDSRTGGALAPTLLAWLDAHGDRLLVADRLGIHTNTVAYRIRRARALLSLDLQDPTVRLELHLRLRALLEGEQS